MADWSITADGRNRSSPLPSIIGSSPIADVTIFPNKNQRIDPAYSAAVDADDLAALITKLGLGPAHIVGESYGAYAGLFLAVRHPELVRSLVLAEAPMMRWLNATPEGKGFYDEFQDHLWQPVGRAFRENKPQEAMRIAVKYFLAGATLEEIPAESRALIEANLSEWQALSTSTDAFPSLRREEVAGVRAPTLLMGGEATLPLQKLLDAQYAALLPNCQRVVIEHATHEMWDEQPVACREKTLQFLASSDPVRSNSQLVYVRCGFRIRLRAGSSRAARQSHRLQQRRRPRRRDRSRTDRFRFARATMTSLF